MILKRERYYRISVQCVLNVFGMVDREDQKADQTADRDCLFSARAFG